MANDIFKKKYLHNLLIFLIYIIVIILVMKGKGFLSTHDDAWFPSNYSRFHSLIDWLTYRYNTWSGRLAIEMVLPYVLKANVWGWRFLNVGAFLIMTFCIFSLGGGHGKLQTPKKQWLVWMFILFMVFVTKRGVLEPAMFWATGSMNYLWPTACLCAALIPFSHLLEGRNAPIWIWFVILLPAIYASYQEQTALILTSFSVFSLVVYRVTAKRISIPGLILAGVMIFNLIILVSAPGNFVRMEMEVLKFFPDFNSMRILQKAYYGANYTLLNHWLYDSVRPFLIITLLTCYLGFRKSTSKVVRTATCCPLLYILFCIIFTEVLGREFAQILNLNIYGTIESLTGTKTFDLNFIPVVTGISIMLLIPTIWFWLFRNSETLVKLILFYFAGICSSFIISFSPTMFASGFRVFFVPDMMMIIVGCILFVESLDYLDLKNKLFVFCYCLLSFTGVSKIIQLIY